MSEIDDLPTKEELERHKLQLEIRSLRSPFRHGPALWISSVTTFLAVCGFLLQLSLNHYERVVAEQKLTLAKIESERITIQTSEAKQSLEKIKVELASTSARLDTAKQLLEESLQSAPASLQAKIREFSSFSEEKKFYDPTGKHPFHVPPAK